MRRKPVFDGLTQREIADRLGISQMHVSRLLKISIDQLSELALELDKSAVRPLLMPRPPR